MHARGSPGSPENGETHSNEGSAGFSKDAPALDQDASEDGSFSMPERLGRVLPGVPEYFQRFFEIGYRDGRVYPVIKPAQQLYEETGLDQGRLGSMTQAATIARVQDANLPTKNNHEARFEAVLRVQRALRHSLSGWPSSVVDIMLRDPIDDKVYPTVGLDMLSTKFGFTYDVGEAEHRPITIQIDQMREGFKMDRDQFDDYYFGTGVEYGSNTDQLNRRMDHFYWVMSPRSPRRESPGPE